MLKSVFNLFLMNFLLPQLLTHSNIHPDRHLTDLNPLVYFQYLGNWSSNYSYFSGGKKGIMLAKFYLNGTSNSLGIKFQQRETKYVDSRSLLTYVTLPKLSQDLKPLNSSHQQTALVYDSDEGELISERNCIVKVQLKFNQQQASLSGKISSKQCSYQVDFSITKRLPRSSKKLLYFLLFMLMPISISIYFNQSLLNHFIENIVQAHRISMTTSSFIIYGQVFLSLVLVYIGIWALSQSVLGLLMIMAGVVWFTVGVGFGMRLIILVWKSRLGGMNSQELKLQILIFYIRFYLGSLFYFLMIIRYSNDAWFMSLHSFLLVPQIIRNVFRGNSPGFYPKYIFGFVLVNFLIPLYFRGCPDNIQDLSPLYAFCLFFVASQIFFVLILYLQYIKGPRFFIPKWCIPNYYEYEIDVQNQKEQGLMQDCAICMVQLLMFQNAGKQCKVWKTPCQHLFHKDCLKGWLQIKLECPSCRMKLPVP